MKVVMNLNFTSRDLFCDEYTWELAWNVMKDYLTDQGNTEIRGSLDAFKEALSIGLIEDEVGWRNTIAIRQQTAHNYNETVLNEIGDEIIHQYYALFCTFEKKWIRLLLMNHEIWINRRSN